MEENAESGGSNDDKNESDWKIFETLCSGLDQRDIMDEPNEVSCEKVSEFSHDVTTSLRSEVAALQYKRDRLTSEVIDMKSQLHSRDQKILQLQVESDQLREQNVRQNAITASLRKKVEELEDRERDLYATQGRQEIKIQTLQRENQYYADKIKDLEKKSRTLEMDLSSEEQLKEAARAQLQELLRRLSVALGDQTTDMLQLTSEGVIHKASEVVQEISRLRNRSLNVQENLTSAEIELRACRENSERVHNDKDMLQRQCASQLAEIDHLRKEKDNLEMHVRVMEREMNELRDKLSVCNKSLGAVTSSVAQHETSLCHLRDENNVKEERYQRLQNDMRGLLDSLAMTLGINRFVEAHEVAIKERVRELVNELKDKATQIDALKEKIQVDEQQYNRQLVINEQQISRLRCLEEDKHMLENRIAKLDSDRKQCEMSRENMKRDRSSFMNFLERLARAMNMDEISQEIGIDLHTESLLVRAEQLARLESDKLVDKYYYGYPYYYTYPYYGLRRERSFPDLRDLKYLPNTTSVVYQLQRRLRTLREQLQRKDLHLDLLRRKLALHEDDIKVKCVLQNERDDAQTRAKKLAKTTDKLQMQLADARAQIRDLNAQLAEAAEYKITCLERERKIEELQKRLVDSELLRTRYNRKVALLKEQLRNNSDQTCQERQVHEQANTLLRDEVNRVKDELSDVTRQLNQLHTFKGQIAKILGCSSTLLDYEIINRLQKLVDAHHDFTTVSRRYDDPVLRLTTRSPTHSRCTARTPDRSLRYDDSGYLDGHELVDDLDDDLYNKRLTSFTKNM